MPKQRPTLTGRNVKRRGQGLGEDDLDTATPQDGTTGGVTSGETVTLGAGGRELDSTQTAEQLKGQEQSRQQQSAQRQS